jgi:CelD/BcsL family acetyltransferase involved in cellulose biosynthesis
MHYEQLQTWWSTRGGGEWPQAEPALVTAHRDSQLAAAAPLFFTPNHDGRPALLLLGSVEVSDYLDLLVREADLPEFLDALLPFLMNNPDLPVWEVLDLYNVLGSSPTVAALEAAAGRHGLRCVVEKYKSSPYIDLPGEWDAYLAGIDKKQRHEIRRKIRRLEEKSGLPNRWYFAEDPENLEADSEDFLALMAQEGDKADFLTPEMRAHMKNVIRTASAGGYLKLAFLEIDGKKAAAKLCFDYNNQILAYNSGINRELMAFSPGWVILGYMLKWANEEGRELFDFMRGDEEYKYRFGAVDRFVLRVTLSRA